MDVEIATLEDVDALVDLWVALAADQRRHGSHVLPAANRTRIRESIVRHVVDDCVVVARVDGDIVGFVTFSIEDGTYEQDVRRGLVENLYVVPARQGEGIGSTLLSRAEAALSERDVDVVGLETLAANEDARSFYRRHGYDEHRVSFEKRLESDTHSKGDR